MSTFSRGFWYSVCVPSLALAAAGAALACGSDAYSFGQLGHGTTVQRLAPVKVLGQS